MPVIQNKKQEMTERSADHRLCDENKAHTVLAQYSFDLRRRLRNTILGFTLKIIMSELMVNVVCSRARYYTKTLQEGKSGLFRPSHTPR